MADFNSGLPVRTENAGDVVVKVGDATTPSQQLAIDSTGRVVVKLDDGSGNLITSQTSGAQRALDVGINVAGTQVDPRSIRALTAADVVTANIGTTNGLALDATLTGGTQKTKLVDSAGTNLATISAAGALKIDGSATTQPVSGTITANAGTGTFTTSDLADGSVTGGTAGTKSMLAGGQFNTSAPTLTTGQQAALQLNVSGALKIDGSATTQPVSGTVTANAGTGSFTVAQATAANLNATVVGTVTANIKDATGTAFSSANPLPVTFSATLPGTTINDYNTATAIAAAASSNHDYTITTSKTFTSKKFWAAASGKMKIEVQISPDGTTFTSKWVGFNSTANPNITIDLDLISIIDSGVGSKLRIIRTNLDKAAMDVYSTISGTET